MSLMFALVLFNQILIHQKIVSYICCYGNLSRFLREKGCILIEIATN